MSGPGVKVSMRKTDNIRSSANLPKGAVNTRSIQTPGCIVRQYDTKIEIAVGTSITARLGPKQIDTYRVVERYEAPGDFRDCFGLCQLILH